jgi:hypothetical protein
MVHPEHHRHEHQQPQQRRVSDLVPQGVHRAFNGRPGGMRDRACAGAPNAAAA